MTAEVIPYWRGAIRKANRDEQCAQVNARVAREILDGLNRVELDQHINELTVEVKAKRAGLQITLESLARALSERQDRRNG